MKVLNANMRFLVLVLLATVAVWTQAESDFYCYQCSDASDNAECKAVTTCPEKSKCLTQIHFTTEGLIMQKRCSKMQMCYNYEENNDDKCSQPDEEFEGICSYCCDTAGCNKGLPPYGTEHVREDDKSSGSGLSGILNLQSWIQHFKPHVAPTPKAKSGSKSGHKPTSLNHNKSGDKSGHKHGGLSNIKPGGLSHPKSGGKTGPKPGGLSLPKPGGLSHTKSGGKTGPKPGGLSHAKPGGKTGPTSGGTNHNNGGLSKLKTPTVTMPKTKPTTAGTPAATNPPATHAPAQTGSNTGVNVVNTCHCHAGQPCYVNHANAAQGVKVPSGGGIDVNIHIDLGSLLGLNLGNCPCANQKPVVNVQQATVPPPTKATAPPTTVAPPKPQTQPTAPPTTHPTLPPTTKPTMKPTTQPATTPTTTVPTTKPTTTIPTTTIRPTYCYTCTDQSCLNTKLTACPSDQYYCMNTISQTATGARTFTKECVLEQTCNDKWWLGTAGRPDCFLLDSSPSGPPGMPLDKCSFCCHGDGCNKDALPSSSSLYNPKSFGQNSLPSTKAPTVKPPIPQTHPTTPSTTTQPSTTTAQPTTVTTKATTEPSTTKAPTTTNKPTTQKAVHKGNVITCAVCGDYNNQIPCTFLETMTAPQIPCPPYQFCMNDVIYDATGTQMLYKRCVSHTQCNRQWYEETSDRSQCTKMNLNNPPLKTTCHFCCKTNGCNSDIIPDRSTFFIP